MATRFDTKTMALPNLLVIRKPRLFRFLVIVLLMILSLFVSAPSPPKVSAADTGNSPITNYQILRGTTSGAETFLANVTGTQIGGSYSDNTATDRTVTYYYKIVAQNAVGNSLAKNEIAAPYVGETCTGLIIHRNDPSHPESTGGGSAGQPPTPSLLIDYIAVGEPAGSDNLVFKT